MDKKIYLLFFLTLTSLEGFSQTINPEDSVSAKRIELNIEKDGIRNEWQGIKSSSIELDREYSSYGPINNSYDKPLDLKLSSVITGYIGPPSVTFSNSRYPYANDYYYSGALYGFSKKAWITGGSLNKTYPTFGHLRQVNATINYKVADWLYISGGSYAAKYEFNGIYYNDFGANTALKFKLHDRLWINGYYQYSGNAKHNMMSSMGGMFPSTYYGGSLEIKITEKLGVEGGVIRELNPVSRKWENRPFIIPKFYIK